MRILITSCAYRQMQNRASIKRVKDERRQQHSANNENESEKVIR